MTHSAHGPASYKEVLALAERMARSPADAVSFAGRLSELVTSLPPAKSELLSRPMFERATLWTLVASFENVEVGPEAPPLTIRVQHDAWIRGVVACAIPDIAVAEVPPAQYLPFLAFQCWRTTNNRDKFETNWRIDGKQGFVSNGTGEILAPATLATGDSEYPANLDWRLQKDQTIQVRVRSRWNEFQPSEVEDDEAAAARIRWLVVAFWEEELNQPSVR